MEKWSSIDMHWNMILKVEFQELLFFFPLHFFFCAAILLPKGIIQDILEVFLEITAAETTILAAKNLTMWVSTERSGFFWSTILKIGSIQYREY